MSDTPAPPAPATWRNLIGPGFIVGATGIGAGSLFAVIVVGHISESPFTGLIG